MKKVRTIKILVTTREILAIRSKLQEVSTETDLPLCPTCQSRIAEAVSSAVTVLSEADAEIKVTTENNGETFNEEIISPH